MSYKVYLGVPSCGDLCEEAAEASWLCSLKHAVDREASTTLGLNFNEVLRRGLQRGRDGRATHLAMMHSDIHVVEDEEGLRWIDRLIEEMDAVDADFISVPMRIKDHRGVTSSGIGDPNHRWEPFRRWTTVELKAMPRTFNAEQVGYGDKFLLHNEALCVFDLRKPLWQIPDEYGVSRCDFNVEERIRLVKNQWVRDQETEDWGFSRKLWQMGAKTYLTSRVEVLHFGRIAWSNRDEAVTYQNGDENSAHKWRTTSAV